MQKNDVIIGLFDSGLGGITVWKEINNKLPQLSTIYLADSKNAPYGSKSKDEIIALCKKNIDFLLTKNVSSIVVACNTATTNAINELRTEYNLPIIGVEPAIKPAVLASKSKKIGVLATLATLQSEKYIEAKKSFPKVEFVEQAGHHLVQLIESGKLYSEELKKLLIQYVTPMRDAQVDHIVLGCTHYPFFKSILKEITDSSIQIIDSGAAIANRVHQILESNDLPTDSSTLFHKFYINKSSNVMKSLLKNDKVSIIEFDF